MAYAFLIVIFTFSVFFAVNMESAGRTKSNFKKFLLYTLATTNFVGAIATTILLLTH
jgi:hypothetical protein